MTGASHGQYGGHLLTKQLNSEIEWSLKKKNTYLCSQTFMYPCGLLRNHYPLNQNSVLWIMFADNTGTKTT